MARKINFYILHLLELAFAQKSLRDLCESQLKAERKFGIKVARNLRARLADLWNAESVGDLIAGRPQILDSRRGLMAVALGEGMRIIFCANHVSNPRKDNGKVNWSRVNRIKILEIGVDQ